MGTMRSHGLCAWLLATLLMAADGMAVVQALDEAPRPDGEDSVSEPRRTDSNRQQPWPRVDIADPWARQVVVNALEAVSALFEAPGCRQLLAEFADGEGQPLVNRLATLTVDAQTYVTMVTFVADNYHPACSRGALAFTSPGSRIVRVCAEPLKRLWQHRPNYIVAAFVHELLHTLGLGENPPSSGEITARVLARCQL